MSEAQTVEVKVTKLPQEAIMDRWEQVSPLLDKACSYSGGRFTPETVLQGLMSGGGQLQLFVAFEDDATVKAAAVTCLTVFGTGLKVCEILLLGGHERKSWLHFQKTIRRWAKTQGCERMLVHGRKGWVKDLSDWKVSGMIFERPIEDE